MDRNKVREGRVKFKNSHGICCLLLLGKLIYFACPFIILLYAIALVQLTYAPIHSYKSITRKDNHMAQLYRDTGSNINAFDENSDNQCKALMAFLNPKLVFKTEKSVYFHEHLYMWR